MNFVACGKKFNLTEFREFRIKAVAVSRFLQQWVERTNAIGMVGSECLIVKIDLRFIISSITIRFVSIMHLTIYAAVGQG